MTSLNIFKYFNSEYLNRTHIYIDIYNFCTINYKCIPSSKINMFCYYYLEILICLCLKKKITNMYIVKNIMISLFNDKFMLQLLNILIDEYLKKIFN